MGIGCWLFGHSMVPTGDVGDIDKWEVVCEDCGHEEWWSGKRVCEEHDCVEYVIGINALGTSRPKREYSQRCYRCPRCGDTWNDDDGELLEGHWKARNGKAVHYTEMSDDECKKISIEMWNKIKNASSIRDVRKVVEEIEK